MRSTSKCLIGVASLVFFAARAPAVERVAGAARAEAVKVKTVQQTVRAPVRHEYENVAGFKGRLNDPLYAYAAEPQAMGPRIPAVTQWPMPNAVWW